KKWLISSQKSKTSLYFISSLFSYCLIPFPKKPYSFIDILSLLEIII
ncbi:unnamed protein product, partial [marine sediment metagenome]